MWCAGVPPGAAPSPCIVVPGTLRGCGSRQQSSLRLLQKSCGGADRCACAAFFPADDEQTAAVRPPPAQPVLLPRTYQYYVEEYA